MNSEKKINLSKKFKDQLSPQSQFIKKKIPGIKKIIAISSAKGGVGKSTICSNLAVALEKRKYKIGILDADIYGPSIPSLFGIYSKPTSDNQNNINPIVAQNIKIISIGFLIDKDSPMIWRGPMVTSAINTFFDKVNWGDLDCLLIDLPPGTGDIILTFIQKIYISSSIIITTPQKLSISDASRGIEMFKKTNVPILGIIENMSYIEDKNLNKIYPFGKGCTENLSKEKNIKILEKIKIHETFNSTSEEGVVFENLNEKIKDLFIKISKEII